MLPILHADPQKQGTASLLCTPWISSKNIFINSHVSQQWIICYVCEYFKEEKKKAIPPTRAPENSCLEMGEGKTSLLLFLTFMSFFYLCLNWSRAFPSS